MRLISSFGLLCIFNLSACGQAYTHHKRVSNADSTKIRTYEYKSIHFKEKAPDSAIYYAEKGLRFAKHINYSFGKAIMLEQFAAINGQYGNLTLAIKYQTEALKIFNTLHRTSESIDGSAKLGILQGKHGNFKTGINLVQNALIQYTKRTDTTGILKSFTALAELYELQGNTDKALEYYTDAINLDKQRLTHEVSSGFNSIGRLHMKLGNHQQALNYYDTAIEKSDNKSKDHITFLNSAGQVLNAMGQTDKALAYHRRGLQKAKALNLPEEEARSLVAIATTLKSNDADLSIRHLKNALEIAHNIGHKQLSSEIYSSLSNIYKQQADYQDALIALEHHHRLLDSISDANKGHKIAVLQSSYELTESKLNIETLELANKQKTYQRNLSLISAVAILIILIVLAGYFYKINSLNKRLDRLNRIKDKLFSILGHDLRTPIGGITQLLTLMDEEELSTEDRKKMVSEMRRQGLITLEILNSLLSWGEAQLNGIHIKVVDFDAKAVIDRNITALYSQTTAKSISIVNYLSNGLIINGDIDHFDFVIRNLISNAIKFSPPSGKIEIKADTNSSAPKVLFSITDYGKGISKAQQKLFLNSNLDVSTGTGGEKGTGLGLMLSKEFIKANKGQIWIESELEQGTTFHFTF